MAKNSESSKNSSTTSKPAIPWLAVGSGIVISLIALVIFGSFLGSFLTRLPEEASADFAPTIVRLTAPPVPTATISLNPPTPTVAPTATTIATPDLSVAPSELTVGYYARVGETGGVGVTIRNGASTRNLPVTVAAEGSVLLVLEGPTAGGDYQWWRVRMLDGTEGWAAGDFLVPSAAP